MKEIKLKSLSIRQFKGITSLDIEFNGEDRTISGDNATCKSTIFDSVTWLLFGKDSADRQAFDIIPLDAKNKPLEKVDTEVSGVLLVNDAEIPLKRVFHQKWVKRRGTTETAYDGNETKFTFDSVPVSAGDYKKEIAELVEEGLFKLITNPLYFNNMLDWQNRRSILSEMAGKITNEDIIDRMPARDNASQLRELVDVLNTNKTIEAYKTQIAAQKKLLKDSLAQIPTRIDEATRSLPEKVNETEINDKILKLEAELKEIDAELADVNRKAEKKQKERSDLREQRTAKEDRMDEISREVKKNLNKDQEAEDEAVSNIETRIAELERQIEQVQRQIDFENESLTADQSAVNKLRESFKEINGEQIIFGDDEFMCPTCEREYETDDTNARKMVMTTAFNKSKRERLEDCNAKGSNLNNRIAATQKAIKLKGENKESLEKELVTANAALENRPTIEKVDLDGALKKHSQYVGLAEQVEKLNEQLSKGADAQDTSKQTDRKDEIREDLDEFKRQLTTNVTRTRGLERIDELKGEEEDLAQQIADLEGTEFTIDEYIKSRTNLVESRINDKFSMVRFKMYKQNINGGEEPTCETLINGVPFASANTAGQVNAGMDIINTLSEFYGITAPVFIDGRESVVNLLPCKAQVINLVVVKGLPLTIN